MFEEGFLNLEQTFGLPQPRRRDSPKSASGFRLLPLSDLHDPVNVLRLPFEPDHQWGNAAIAAQTVRED